MSAAVIVSIRVAAQPTEAFRIFVEDIALWWRPNSLFQLTPRGDGALRFESGEGGRLIAALPNGKEFEVGRITQWTPGRQLSFTWRQASFAPEQSTSVSVEFEPVGEGTRVTVTHRGWETVPSEHAARHGFPLGPFQQRLAENWRELLTRYAGLSIESGRL